MDLSRTKYIGIYRGVVLDNNDTGFLEDNNTIKPFGRCKVFFEGIYPEEFRLENGASLPWAEPVFPIFGGNANSAEQQEKDKDSTPSTIKNYSNSVVGWASVPHVGAYVWGFFENGNIQYPKFFGTTQTGPTWLAEHRNQHVICTDNVKIIIDEAPENENSTSQCNSNNTECTSTATSMGLQEESMPTTVNITITATKPNQGKADKSAYCAINLNIIGNVNSKIQGNVYEEIEGNRFITHTGNLFQKQVGDIEIEHEGNLFETHKGSRTFKILNGDNSETYGQKNTIQVNQDYSESTNANHTLSVSGNESRNVSGNITDKGAMINLN